MDQHQQAYREEAYELLAELETSLLELEENPQDEEQIDRVFRVMHTIKGSSAMFGFDEISTFTHEVETIFDLVRSGDISITKELVNLSLEARDQIILMLGAPDGGEPVDNLKSINIIERFQELGREHIEQNISEDDPDFDNEIKKEENEEELIIFEDQNSINNKDDFEAIDKSEFEVVDKSENEINIIEKCDSEIKKLNQNSDNINQQIKQSQNISNITYRIRFKPDPKILTMGSNPFMLIKNLKDLGDATVIAQTDQVPKLTEINPENCYIYWDIILTTSQGIESIKDIFIFIENDCELTVDIIDDGGDFEFGPDDKKLGEILIERNDITSEDLKQTLLKQKRIGEILIETQLTNRGRIESALAEQKHIRTLRKKRKKETSGESIRVDANKLDTLVDLVGELVTVQAGLTQKAFISDDPELLVLSEQVERLTADLRDNTMNIRMLPISTTFSKFKRLIRDLSNEMGKEIILKTEGGNTELDKKVIERLSDPMIHIIRNAIDHGIERPDQRKKIGKPEAGTISLTAIHSGANVLIKISDDGAGINKEKIRSIAIKKGLISQDDELSDNEIFNLLFTPGFSTSEKITDISGRGVGMDVVKSCIDQLRGSIEIESEEDFGASITLKLPLTLAIIDGLLVDIGEEYYILPLSAVEECVEITAEDRKKANRQNIALIRNEFVPFIPLRELFEINKPRPPVEQVVIVKIDGSSIGFVVDNIIGEHQTVIKSLGRIYQRAKEFSGATILADGTVALIIDVQQLCMLAENFKN